MDWKRIVDPNGLNWWTVVSGMGLNFILASFLFLAVTMLAVREVPEIVFTLVMSVGSFLVPALSAYVCGRISDERFLTYGFYSLIGFMILAVPGILSAPMFGLLTVAFGVLGAINGATLAARQSMKRRRAIYEITQSEN